MMLRKDLNSTVSLIFNQDGTYDLILNYEQNGMKLSKEFDLKRKRTKFQNQFFQIKNYFLALNGDI